MLEIYEKIHSSGIIYNDLKLDNIVIGNYSDKEKNLKQIRLIDFGFATRFENDKGIHI